VKTFLAALLCLALANHSNAKDMDTDGIKDFVKRIDDALPRGKTFHVNYVVSNQCTDFWFDHANEMIKFISDFRAKAKTDPAQAASLPPDAAIDGQINAFKRDLKATRESIALIDYSLSNQGFYMKQDLSFPNSRPGEMAKPKPMIYVSDGTIMGSFFNDNQATIQPATERPQAAFDDWSQLAYSLTGSSISARISILPELTMVQDGPDIKIHGRLAGEERGASEIELCIDRQTLRPKQIMETNYDRKGAIYNRRVKRWEFQDFSGIVMPKTVIEELYLTGLDGQTRLAQTQTLTINAFSPIPVDAKEALAALLKSNRSIFDEITGSHYLSGNPEQTLDKLSK
jgi:hypothetical protein